VYRAPFVIKLLQVTADQCIHSPGPLELFTDLHQKHCLIVGQGKVMDIADEYPSINASLSLTLFNVVAVFAAEFLTTSAVTKQRITMPHKSVNFNAVSCSILSKNAEFCNVWL